MPAFSRLPKMSVADAKAHLEELKDPEKKLEHGNNLLAEYQRRQKILKAAEIQEAKDSFAAIQKAEKKAATGKKMTDAAGDQVEAARAKANETLFKRRH